MLRALFSIIYFLIFLFLIDLVFRDTLSVYTDILAVVCWIIALIISVGLADFTVKKIKENYKKFKMNCTLFFIYYSFKGCSQENSRSLRSR